MTVSRFPQTLDKAAIATLAVVAIAIGLLLLGGDRSVPRVRSFSWQEDVVSANDRAFTLTFTRPMNHESVEDNLQLDPPLPGKISWAGRRMAYTLNYPAPYGSEFTLQLAGARDRFTETGEIDRQLDPYRSQFRTRDRASIYLGSSDDERGQLVLYNFTRDEKTLLTPADLMVMDFQIYPDSDRVLFSAVDRRQGSDGLTETQLYTVSTGIHFGDDTTDPPGKIERVLDNRDYQNLQFALSPDGTTIVVQRANRDNPGADFGLWAIRDGRAPEQLNSEPGGEFVIAPNSQELAIAQGQGVAILSLDPDADHQEPLQFFPQFGRVMGFRRDGRAAVMVKFNTDYTRSLFLVPNDGEPEEILRTTGSILNAEFDATGRFLYLLLTELVEADDYIERPYILAVDLEQDSSRELVRFDRSPLDLSFSLSPDGRAILFDRLSVSSNASRPDIPLTESGAAIEASDLWILFPLIDDEGEQARPQPEQLPLNGFRPAWLP